MGKRPAGATVKSLAQAGRLHAADVKDRDGGVMLMATLFGLYPFLLKLYADGGYQGPAFRNALGLVCRQLNVEIVKRSDAERFMVLPKR